MPTSTDASMISLWPLLDATTHNTRPILSHRHEIGLVRAWLKRQYTLGKTPNADALWTYIRDQRPVHGHRQSDRALAKGETRFIPTPAQALVP